MSSQQLSSSSELSSSSTSELLRAQKPRRVRTCTSNLCGLPYWALGLVLLGVLAAILVPGAMILGRMKGQNPERRSQVLVPLYVYPGGDAWDPLIQAAQHYPHLDFTAVVNPANGPGPGAEPDGNYTLAISRLNSYPNVRMVGYVATNWTNRDISLALAEIKTYSAWATNAGNPNLRLGGIFLDEAPTRWTAESQAYLEKVADAIWGDAGLGMEPLVIQNPGAVPDSRFMYSCNVSVVFEEAYETYQNNDSHKIISDFEHSSGTERSAMAVLMHSLPATLSNKEQTSLVRNLKLVAGNVFLTGLSVDYYSSFGDGWGDFVDDMVR
ncbi:unnamed protein product [Diplocarpon coronariae]|uniref:Spherulin 4-like cell surface protein n=1 Tax=Diplocarpon coronariae TaxID=2795749 RepID=A0A218ZD68_9HELO|nr:hypothetical protein B2J93_1768 [Marssonina coronariae]